MTAMILARAAGLLVASGMLAAACPPAEHAKSLDGTCFSRADDTANLRENSGFRVRAVSVRLQEFQGGLLAGVSYRLRYGPEFGLSGDCSKSAEGDYQCTSCPGQSCKDDSETFRIVLYDDDTLQLVGEKPGLVAKNPQGGRDRLRLASEPPAFVLQRAASGDDCAV
jgi:hypothetical protein